MSVSKLNAEGYSDITAYEALTAIARRGQINKRYLPLVYIASPFAGDVETNTACAQGYCRFALNKGVIPLAPHLHYPQFMNDQNEEERSLGLRFALILLGKCDELWVFGDRISNGMAQEIAKAKRRGMPIRYFNGNCKGVSECET